MPSGLRWTTTARLDHPVEPFPRSAGSIQGTSFTVSSAAPFAMNMPSAVQLRAGKAPTIDHPRQGGDIYRKGVVPKGIVN